MRIIPEILINNSEYFARICVCFRIEVNSAERIITTHCPIAKQNSKAIENIILFDIVANAIMLASIGEEQGLDARAKNTPIINGSINSPLFVFCGIFFTIAGKLICINPIKFKPNIIIIDANSNIIIGEAKLVNALPVNAQNTPIILRIKDNPKENDSICINNLLLSVLEYPPI